MNRIEKLQDEAERGENAKRLMSDPLLSEAFEAVETALIASIKRVDVGAADQQRDLIVSLQLLGKVKSYLTTTIQTGRMAEIELQKGAR